MQFSYNSQNLNTFKIKLCLQIYEKPIFFEIQNFNMHNL